MAYGLPVISFDCESGPGEIIRDSVDALIVPAEDVSLLAKAMGRLMSNESERARLGSEARDVTERFGVETFISRWDALLGTADVNSLAEATG